ncbi:MAG: hypothetical protein U5Q44_08440 [Dehalococcoidia bacterium]|nr:hypothetical protein [Dehalococcoidia bacterium]
MQILQPYLGRADMDWYQGTSEHHLRRTCVVEDEGARSAHPGRGSHLPDPLRYRNMIAYHPEQAADVTVAVYSVPAKRTASGYST